ncbi:MAG: ParA family protein [Candidatus Pacearchaeota archaeon]|nr:ParA family protein [Candidatus Pacearchaeota archaeon]
MPTIIALLNMKGGVGKTTLAVNLAWHSYRFKKKSVLLVDLDPQFNASQYMMDYDTYERHVTTNGTIADLLIDQPALGLRKKKVRPPTKQSIATIVKAPSGFRLDFLPSQLALAHVVKNPAQMDYRLERILSEVRDEYDYIFIDCAPTDSVLTTMALTASNYILIPIRPDRFSILGYGNLVETVRAFKANSQDPNNVSELGLIFTQVRGDSDVERTCMDDIREQAAHYGSYVFPSGLKFSTTFIRAVQNQTPAFETKYARDELKTNIKNIVKEMEQRIEAVEEGRYQKLL